MDTEALLNKGRAAYERWDWGPSFEALSQADLLRPLLAEDLERCAFAANLSGRREDCYRYLRRAYREHLNGGDARAASRAAFWLGFELSSAGEAAQASAWLARSERQLPEGGDCVERGYLLLPRIEAYIGGGRLDRAVEAAADAVAIAERFGDRDLRAFAVHAHGVALVRQGRIRNGMSLLDEAMLAVTVDGVSPFLAGIIYCSAISACRSVFAFQRMQEWTNVLKRWCAEQSGLMMFVGECKVYRSELLQFSGDWPDALAEAEQALELGPVGPEPRVLGLAWYQVGELRRLQGDHDAAEAAYREALRTGHDPQPGLALLWLAQGKSEAAVRALGRALEETRRDQKRSRLLPAYVHALLDIGDVEAARVACGELAAIAGPYRDDAPSEPPPGSVTAESPTEMNLIEATVAECSGLLELADGRTSEALVDLRRACGGYRELDAPYDVARVRVQIGRACRMLGDRPTADMELAAARATFDALGAAVDRRRVDDLLRPAERESGSLLTGREAQVLSLVASGLTNRDVARELGLSVRTIDRHVSNIFDKLGVSSRAAAAAKATGLGLIEATAR